MQCSSGDCHLAVARDVGVGGVNGHHGVVFPYGGTEQQRAILPHLQR